MPLYDVTYADGAARVVDAPDEAAAKAHAERKNVLDATRKQQPAPDHGAVASVTLKPE